MKTKQFKHKELLWVSIYHLDQTLRVYLNDGWQLKSLSYLDRDFTLKNPDKIKVVSGESYSDRVRLRFVRPYDGSKPNMLRV